MALKKCKECGAEISDSAKECPKCGKEQRNIITKHPILSVLVGLMALGMIISFTVPRTMHPATISRNTGEDANIEESQNKVSDLTISLGDTINGKDKEVSIESVNFSQKVEPPVMKSFYNYYQVDNSDNTYLYMILNCKNISTIDIDASSVANVKVKYNNAYTYNSFSAVPDNTLGFTYSNITKIKPLTSQQIYYLAEMPKTIADENTPIEIDILFENNTYKYQYR